MNKTRTRKKAKNPRRQKPVPKAGQKQPSLNGRCIDYYYLGISSTLEIHFVARPTCIFFNYTSPVIRLMKKPKHSFKVP